MWRLFHWLFGWHYVASGGRVYGFVHRLYFSKGEDRPFIVDSYKLQFYCPETGKFEHSDWTPLTFNRADFEQRFGKPAPLREVGAA